VGLGTQKNTGKGWKRRLSFSILSSTPHSTQGSACHIALRHCDCSHVKQPC
jgi:hypothetical protein